MKYSCGHQADPMLTRAVVQQQKWCFDCDPAIRAKRDEQRRESRARNARTQRDLDRIGMGQYGPLPDEDRIVWNPTPEQFMDAVRALAIWGPVLDRKDEQS